MNQLNEFDLSQPLDVLFEDKAVQDYCLNADDSIAEKIRKIQELMAYVKERAKEDEDGMYYYEDGGEAEQILQECQLNFSAKPTVQALQSVEERIGFALPQAYKDFLLFYGFLVIGIENRYAIYALQLRALDRAKLDVGDYANEEIGYSMDDNITNGQTPTSLQQGTYLFAHHCDNNDNVEGYYFDKNEILENGELKVMSIDNHGIESVSVWHYAQPEVASRKELNFSAFISEKLSENIERILMWG